MYFKGQVHILANKAVLKGAIFNIKKIAPFYQILLEKNSSFKIEYIFKS